MAFFAIAASSAQAAFEDWSIETSVGGGSSFDLPGISCTAPNACVAAGYYQLSPEKDPYVLRRAGEFEWELEWKSEALPEITEAEASLAGVSCPTSTTCIAVGNYKQKFQYTKALAERRTESGWENQFPPNPAGALETKLEAVSCAASSVCTAVGYYKNSSNEIVTLAEQWNGKEWAIQTTPNPKGEEAILTGVSCPSTSECLAVGRYKTGGVILPLAERWNGSTWEVLYPKLPAEAVEARLEDISCPTGSSVCTAVGRYENKSGKKLTLAERWKGGSWEIQSTPNPEGAEEASLNGVSCPIEGVCTAVGSYKASSIVKPLGERLGGGSWQLTLPEQSGETESVLSAISCTSINFCMTSGRYKSAFVFSLFESYQWFEPPVNTTKPTISPTTPETGKALTANPGTWSEDPGYTYQWKRCNASGLECVSLSGETKATYYPLAADIEKTLVVEVTATNPAGNASASSAATGKAVKAGVVTEYALPANSGPVGIIVGPDENLWFANNGTTKVGKITTSGTVTEYSINTEKGLYPFAIAKGSDGNLWFNFGQSGGRVGKVSTGGAITYYDLSKGMNNGRDMAPGPDGNLWFAATEGRVGKITTSGTFTSYEVSGGPTGITAGPDGNLWLTKEATNKVAKMTTGGTVTDYSLPSATAPYGIASGPDEKLWFGANGKIGKISTAGTVTEYSLPAAGRVTGIAEGPDGLLWFAHYGADKVGKITTGGTITEYALPAGSKPWDIAAGPDGNVWFTLHGGSRIGMIEP